MYHTRRVVVFPHFARIPCGVQGIALRVRSPCLYFLLGFILGFEGGACSEVEDRLSSRARAAASCKIDAMTDWRRSVLTKDENQLITRTGPDTPGGTLMRCYWHPVALAEEMPSAARPCRFRSSARSWCCFAMIVTNSACSASTARIAVPISATAGSRTAGCDASIMAGFTTSMGAAWSSRRSRRRAATRTRFGT